jgi:hypothetical protein
MHRVLGFRFSNTNNQATPVKEVKEVQCEKQFYSH